MKMRLSIEVALAALCITVVRGESQKPISVEGESVHGSPFTKEYEKHVGKLLEDWHVPGVAIGIVDGDNIWTEVGFVTTCAVFMAAITSSVGFQSSTPSGGL